jgi:ABC-type branched-subunit amino acid transport system substrate-binding protein
VDQSKNVTDAILALTQAATRASSNPSKETYQEVVRNVELAEAAIGKLTSFHASDVNLLRDLDEAVEVCKSPDAFKTVCVT